MDLIYIRPALKECTKQSSERPEKSTKILTRYRVIIAVTVGLRRTLQYIYNSVLKDCRDHCVPYVATIYILLDRRMR